MLRYALKRLRALVISLMVASLVIFAVIEVVPGDPASFMLGINAQPETVAALRDQLSLNQPLHLRYLSWVGGLLTGDFGTSYTYRSPVADIILQRLAVSLPLASFALLLTVIIAFPAGVLACLLYTSPSPRDQRGSRMPSSA